MATQLEQDNTIKRREFVAMVKQITPTIIANAMANKSTTGNNVEIINSAINEYLKQYTAAMQSPEYKHLQTIPSFAPSVFLINVEELFKIISPVKGTKIVCEINTPNTLTEKGLAQVLLNFSLKGGSSLNSNIIYRIAVISKDYVDDPGWRVLSVCLGLDSTKNNEIMKERASYATFSPIGRKMNVFKNKQLLNENSLFSRGKNFLSYGNRGGKYKKSMKKRKTKMRTKRRTKMTKKRTKRSKRKGNTKKGG